MVLGSEVEKPSIINRKKFPLLMEIFINDFILNIS